MDYQACPENRDKPKKTYDDRHRRKLRKTRLTSMSIVLSSDPRLGATFLDIWARLSIPDGKLLPR